jgi:hypothetical protein
LRVFTLSFISPFSSAAAAALPLSAALMTLARARVFGLTCDWRWREEDEAARGEDGLLIGEKKKGDSPGAVTEKMCTLSGGGVGVYFLAAVADAWGRAGMDRLPVGVG